MPMNGKGKSIPADWADPDDAPELSEEDFARGQWMIGEQEVSRKEAQQAVRNLLRGRPAGTSTKTSTTIRFDNDVLAAFKASGKGWQSRINSALREWLKENNP